jgi:hypothetical protein
MTRILDARCPARDTAGAPHGSVALWITAWTWVIEDGCDATIPAVPRGGGAIWGRDRIEEDWGGGFDAGYPQCPGSIGPSGAEIVLSGRAGGGPSSARPCPQCPMRTHLGPAAQPGGGCNTLVRYRQCPGSGAHPGQRSYWACAGVEAPPPPGSIPGVPQKDAPEAGSGAGGTAATWVRYLHNAPGRGSIRGRDRIGQGADRGAAPPPGAYPQCPRRTRLA